MAEQLDRFATFSADRRYRYGLARRWAPRGSAGDGALWVMLNPSTADDKEDDNTVRRCIGFSKTFGFASCMVVNLFALISTDPAELLAAEDPVGPDNDVVLVNMAQEAQTVIVAWGAWGSTFPERAATVTDLLRRSIFYAQHLHCLGLTAEGQPCHPARLLASTKLEVFRG